MVCKIIKDVGELTRKSALIDFKKDKALLKQLIRDMQDTAKANEPNCVGLAAPQIGVHKKVVLAKIYGKFKAFVNPVIRWHGTDTYIAEEGCLSIDGKREARRYYEIEVMYRDLKGNLHIDPFKNFAAEILQHEIDHLNGVLIGEVQHG